MDSLNDILSRKDFDERAESLAIKKYVREQFDETVAVQVREREIIIAAPSAALAGTLRIKTVELRRLLDTDKRLVFRIGK
ncbi:MAG TPA: hypothetical protein VGG13_01235 [Candidatus Saccharimonadales bacterium]